MGAAMNGIAAYGVNLIPCAGTFLNFVSYAAGAVRLSALGRLRVVWIATHDSIALGEDGPTHQPIETLAHFQARPADGNETSAAYVVALAVSHTPSILALTRQRDGLNFKPAPSRMLLAVAMLFSSNEDAAITLVSTGSEVSVCMEAADVLLSKHGVRANIVSMPLQPPPSYLQRPLPRSHKYIPPAQQSCKGRAITLAWAMRLKRS
jgi:transketolase